MRIDDKKYKRFSDHIGSFPVVFISPTDTNLITENSDTRRRYIDSGISQFDSGYLKNLISYNKTLKQRRAFSMRFIGDDVRFLDRGGPTSPPFDGISLNSGDLMREDWFPKVFNS